MKNKDASREAHMAKMKKSVAILVMLACFFVTFLSLRYTSNMLAWLRLHNQGILFYYLNSYLPFAFISIAGAYLYWRLGLRVNFDFRKTEREMFFWTFMVTLFAVLFDRYVSDTRWLYIPDLAYALTLPILVALGEELICRVVLMKTLESAFSFRFALLFQAVFFTIFHNDYRVRSIAYFMLFGIFAGLLFKKGKENFTYIFIAHYITDVALLLSKLYFS